MKKKKKMKKKMASLIESNTLSILSTLETQLESLKNIKTQKTLTVASLRQKLENSNQVDCVSEKLSSDESAIAIDYQPVTETIKIREYNCPGLQQLQISILEKLIREQGKHIDELELQLNQRCQIKLTDKICERFNGSFFDFSQENTDMQRLPCRSLSDTTMHSLQVAKKPSIEWYSINTRNQIKNSALGYFPTRHQMKFCRNECTAEAECLKNKLIMALECAQETAAQKMVNTCIGMIEDIKSKLTGALENLKLPITANVEAKEFLDQVTKINDNLEKELEMKWTCLTWMRKEKHEQEMYLRYFLAQLNDVDQSFQRKNAKIDQLASKCQIFEEQLHLKSLALEECRSELANHATTNSIKCSKETVSTSTWVQQVVETKDESTSTLTEGEIGADGKPLLFGSLWTVPGVSDDKDSIIQDLVEKLSCKDEEMQKLREEKENVDIIIQNATFNCQILEETVRDKEMLLAKTLQNLEVCKNEILKKEKLMYQIKEEMGLLQSITSQLEDFQRMVREKDNRIFQLESDLDCEIRVKEEKELTLQSLQNKLKAYRKELEEKEEELAVLQNQQPDNEATIKELRTLQMSWQVELQEKELIGRNAQDQLGKMERLLQETEESNKTMLFQVADLKSKVELLTKNKTEATKTIEELQTQLRKDKEELIATEKVFENWKAKIQTKNAELSTLSLELETKEHIIMNQQSDMKQLMRSNEDHELTIQSLMEELDSLHSDLAEKGKNRLFGFGSFQSDLPSSEELQAKLRNFRHRLHKKEDEVEALHNVLEKKIGYIQFQHTLYITLQAEIQIKHQEIEKYRTQVASLEKETRELQASKHHLTTKLREMVSKNEEQTLIIVSKQRNLEYVSKELEDKKKRMDSLRLQLNSMKQKLENAVKEKDDKRMSLSSLDSQLQNLQRKLQAAQKDRTEAKTHLQSLQLQMQTAQDELELKRKMIEKHEHKIQVYSCQLGTVKMELEDREKMITDLQKKVKQLRQNESEHKLLTQNHLDKIADANKHLQNLKEAVSRLQSDIAVLKQQQMSGKMKSGDLKGRMTLLLKELEMWQCRLQAAQIEWEERETVYHKLIGEVETLQVKQTNSRKASEVMEAEMVGGRNEQARVFRQRCFYMELQMLEEELDSKQAQLKAAAEGLKSTESDKQHIEHEVNNVLMEMDELQGKYDSLADDRASVVSQRSMCL